MRVAVIGSRDYAELERVEEFIENLPQRVVIVSGGARGVDQTAENTAKKRGLVVDSRKPNYEKYGRYRAPLIRNEEIVKDADLVVAFWDGLSRGTYNAINHAYTHRKVVVIIYGTTIDRT